MSEVSTSTNVQTFQFLLTLTSPADSSKALKAAGVSLGQVIKDDIIISYSTTCCGQVPAMAFICSLLDNNDDAIKVCRSS